LASAQGAGQSGSLIMAGISYVFTIARVAKMLGEDEDWLHEICNEMDPEDGCLTVLGPRRRGDNGPSHPSVSIISPSSSRCTKPTPTCGLMLCQSGTPSLAGRRHRTRPDV
jgi:hypothetical protein